MSQRTAKVVALSTGPVVLVARTSCPDGVADGHRSGVRGSCDALPPDAHRGRVARAARLRHDHQQPVRELGRRPAARATSGLDLDLDELVLCYGDHLGDPLLREAVAAGGDGPRRPTTCSSPRARRPRCSRSPPRCSSRAITPWSCAPTTPPTSRRRGRSAPTSTSSTSRFDDGWQLDVDERGRRGAPGHDPADQRHLPAQPDRHDARPRRRCTRLVELAERPGAVLLVDETYRDLTHTGEPLPLAATLSPDVRSASSSMSKAYGLPGMRVGWAVCHRPDARRDAARRQGADGDLRRRRSTRQIAGRVLADRERDPPADPRRRPRAARRSCDDWMAGQETFEWIEPTRRRRRPGAVPRPEVEVDTDRFHDVLLADHGTYVGPGHWFEVDDRHFRLGFGWPTHAELSANCKQLIDRAQRHIK